MSITQFLYLRTAIDKGSLRAAAHSLGVSQPTLSVQIRKLEEELNVVLLSRSAGGVTPTDEARQLVPFIDVVATAQEALERRAGNSSHRPALVPQRDHHQAREQRRFLAAATDRRKLVELRPESP